MASTIGTYMGVGIALLALIGVFGLLLIWRASKIARSQAINVLDSGTAESFGFVGRGIWTGAKSRVFRRVRAPTSKRSHLLTA